MNRRRALAALLCPVLTPAQAQSLPARTIAGAQFILSFAGEARPLSEESVWSWIDRSAQAVAVYYGRFPVPAVAVVVGWRDGRGVRGGRTYPGDVPNIEVGVGTSSSADDLLVRDWVMVHEMVHLAFPWLDLRHNWMAEGLAVYVESIARMQAGHISREQAWGDFVRMMPRGLPAPGDQGLDVTVNWGRTYWGGAIFCLLADIRIRQSTGNRAGLQQALRAINAQRDFRRLWDFRATLEIGDAATGTDVLVAQYERMRNAFVDVDLDGLWTKLGIVASRDRIEIDAHAAWACIRAAIETPIA